MPKRTGPPLRTVGHNVPRAEGVDKVTGAARYIDDLRFPDMLHGATVRSTIPAGVIEAVERDPGFDWSGFTFVDHRDIVAPGRNVVAMIVDDQPLLAVDRIRHQAEPIALLAHADRDRLVAGLAHVRVRCREEPALLDFAAATTVLKELTIRRGDLDGGFARAERVVEGTYATGAQEQLYIEPNGVIAVPGAPEAPDGITVYGSMQCPHYVARALRVLFGIGDAAVRVVQTTTGGGFGGKEEYPSIIAGHAALLAKKAGRPVKMVYDRHEDLIATTKRHPSLTQVRTGLSSDGSITAIEVDLKLDGGAYVTLSPVVLSRACIHAAGPYRTPAVRIHGRVMMTNTPPNGAFRGFGAPQSQFAVEAHMDRIAAELGIDPVELRRRNLLRAGDLTATGQRVDDAVAAEEVLDRALARHAADRARAEAHHATTRAVVQTHNSAARGAVQTHNTAAPSVVQAHNAASPSVVQAHNTASPSVVQAHNTASPSMVQTHNSAAPSVVQAHNAASRPRAQAHHATSRPRAQAHNTASLPMEQAHNRLPSDGLLRGTGVALFFHGSGFTGGGEIKLASRAGLALTEDGVRLLVGSTEIGQGTRTMHAQIVAETLAIPYDTVITADPDTARVPDSGPTVASRTCMVVGRILQRAAERLRAELGPYDGIKQFRRRARDLLRTRGSVEIIEQYDRPSTLRWNDETYEGDAYGAYAWGCNIADVEVDPVTYQARCTRFTTVIDIGKAIHPLLVEGQIEGGTLQGIGWALYEEVVMKRGVMQNAQLTNYIIPTTLDTPPIAVELVERPYADGPFGAKGVGECPIDGPAAAIVNAIAAATGRRLDAVPATPERIMKALV